MIPTNAGTLVGFLLFLAPGILWELLRARHVPSVKETTLIEICRVVLASVVATALAAVFLSWLWVPQYRAAATIDGDDPGDQIRLMMSVAATAMMACGLVLLSSAARWPGKAEIHGVRVWHRAFVMWRDLARTSGLGSPSATTFLEVELLDGTVWRGAYGAMDSDPEDEHRNLALRAPLKRKRPLGGGFVEKNAKVVLIPEAQIQYMQVHYLELPGEPPLTPHPPEKRVSRKR